MRHGNISAVLAVLSVFGCASSDPLKDMVGYVPPTSLPASPQRILVAEDRDQVWDQLVEFLEGSEFEVDHRNEGEGLLIARYSGNPEPYVDCGSIVTHQKGALGQIPGSASTVALNYEIENKPVILNRTLGLDSRIIIRLIDRTRGTVIQTDTTYVVTKTVDVADLSGSVTEGSRETVSFEAGGRGEFSKGTACQPNGSLDLAVLQSLPNIVASDDIDRAELLATGSEADGPSAADEAALASLPDQTTDLSSVKPVDRADAPPDRSVSSITRSDTATASSRRSSDDGYDWVLPEQGLPASALPATEVQQQKAQPVAAPKRAGEHPGSPVDTTIPSSEAAEEQSQPTEQSGAALEQAALGADTSTEDEPPKRDKLPTTIVEDTTRKLLGSLDCGGNEWHFCELVKLTTPYRKRNIEQLFGLTINTTGSFTSQVIGQELKLDVLFPSFPSHLHIAYIRGDAVIDHVMSSSKAWPADISEQLALGDRTIPGPSGLAMIVAIASEVPLFSSPSSDAEDAAVYLGRLKQRLLDLETDTPRGLIAASQLLVFVEDS